MTDAGYREIIDEPVRQCRSGQEPIDARHGDALGAFEAGAHTALVVLHEVVVPPFEDGYEGTPFHDFVGRLQFIANERAV